MNEREPGRQLRRELASNSDIEQIKSRALEYLETEPWFIEAGFEMVNPVSGATVACLVSFEQGDLIDNSTVELAVGYQDLPEPLYKVTYNGNNEITHLYYPDGDDANSPLENAISALNDVLQIANRDYDSNVAEVVGNLYRQVAAANNLNIVGFMKGVLSKSKSMHVADAVRNAVVEYGFDSAERVKYKLLPLDPARSGHSGINITYSEKIGPTTNLEDSAAELYIYLSEHQAGTHIYSITSEDATYEYDDGSDGYMAEAVEPELLDNQEYLELESLFHAAPPISIEAAERISKALDEPLVEEFESITQGYDTATYYPDLDFEILEERCVDANGQPSVRRAAKEILRSIDTAVRYQLTDEQASELAPFYYNPNRAKRLRQFLNTQVYTNQKVARSEIADIHFVAQGIIDELSLENHPVSQAINQLFLDHGSSLGDSFVQRVATEVVMQTHENLVKRIIHDSISVQRMAC